MATDARAESGWALVRRGPFARLFWAGFITSVGDWAALFAQITLADAIAGAAGIVTVLAARLLPGLLGGAIGGLLADRGSTFAAALTIAGVGLVALAFVQTVVGGMGWAAVMGLGAGAAYVTGFTHLHETVSDDLRGRTFGDATRNTIFLGGSIVLASGLGVVWSTRDALRTRPFAAAALRSIAAAGRSLRGGEEPAAPGDGGWAQ